jgi:hypothetical protein
LQAVAITIVCGSKPCHGSSLSRLNLGGLCCGEELQMVGSLWWSFICCIRVLVLFEIGFGVGSYYLASGYAVLVLLRHGQNQSTQSGFGEQVRAS